MRRFPFLLFLERLLLEPAALVPQPPGAGVRCRVVVKGSGFHLPSPIGDAVQEVAIVTDHNQGTLPFGKVLLQPEDALQVDVVGRLVEQKYVRRSQQSPRQRHPASLSR